MVSSTGYTGGGSNSGSGSNCNTRLAGGAVSRNILPSNNHDRVKGAKRHSSESFTYNQQQQQQQHLGRKKTKIDKQTNSQAGNNLKMDSAGKKSGSGYSRGMYLAFVDNALSQKRLGRNEHYNELVSQFKNASLSPASSSSSTPSKAYSTPSPSSHPSTSTLRSWMEALTHVVAQLDRSHSVLIDSIISLPWTTMDDSFVATYTRFIQALLCSRSEFVNMTLEKIVKGFRFQTSGPYTNDSQKHTNFTRRQHYSRLHQLLSSLLYLIPTLPNTLWPLLNRFLPHKRENRNAHVVYFTNALKIVEYCPQLGENVLGAIILRAIQIDVEIQIDIEDLEDDEGMLDEEVFGFNIENPFNRLVGDEDSDSDSDEDDEDTLDIDDISSGEEDSDDDDNDDAATMDGEERALSPKVLKKLKELAAKLDAILNVIFNFLHRINNAASALPPNSAFASVTPTKQALSPLDDSEDLDYLSQTSHILKQAIFEVLLGIFDEKILRTFKTRHIQFVLFWYCSISLKFTDHFIGHLISIVLSADQTDSNYDSTANPVVVPTVTKIASASYIASFVARAKSIDKSNSRKVIGLLLIYLEDKMEELRFIHSHHSQNPATAIQESEKFIQNSVVFYAIAQACLYIFCFRWRDFLDEEEEEEDDGMETLDGVPSAGIRRWMPELEILKQAICSGFNPLKMCSPTVVSQFARMAHKTDFMYCHSIIDANKRQSRSMRRAALNSDSTSTLTTPTVELSNSAIPFPSAQPRLEAPNLPRTSSQPTVVETSIVEATLREGQIDSHFPFDPYKLPLSAEYIHHIYRDWDSGGLDDGDEDEEGDGSDDDDDDASSTEDESSVMNSADSMPSSSVDSEDVNNFLAPPPRHHSTSTANIDIRNLIDPSLLSDESGNEGDDVFSKSFEAMSVSPRRTFVTGH